MARRQPASRSARQLAVAEAPRPDLTRRLTQRGWWVLVVGVALSAAPVWAAHSAPATLGVTLLSALAIAWWWAPCHAKAYRATWLPGSAPRAGCYAICRVQVQATLRSAPAEMWCRDPAIGHVRIGRVAGTVAGPLRVRLRFPKRGYQAIEPIDAHCQQPFGLVDVTARVGTASEVLVLPAPSRLRRSLHERLAQHGAMNRRQRSNDDEPEQLRRYIRGDPPRTIHWRASARARELLVCQRESAATRTVAVVIDTTPPAMGDPRGHLHEQLISATAALLEHVHAIGWRATLHGAAIPPSASDDPRVHLTALALAQPVAGPGLSHCPHDCPAVLLAHAVPVNAPRSVLVIAGSGLREHFHFPRRRW